MVGPTLLCRKGPMTSRDPDQPPPSPLTPHTQSPNIHHVPVSPPQPVRDPYPDRSFRYLPQCDTSYGRHTRGWTVGLQVREFPSGGRRVVGRFLQSLRWTEWSDRLRRSDVSVDTCTRVTPCRRPGSRPGPSGLPVPRLGTHGFLRSSRPDGRLSRRNLCVAS